jgi:putative membrane protein
MMDRTVERALALTLAAAAIGCRTRPGDPQLMDTTVSTSTTSTSVTDSTRVTRDTAVVSTTTRTDTMRTDTTRATTDTMRTSTDSARRTVRTDSAAGTVALPAATVSDADIANVIATIDRSEIEAARLAQSKVSNSDVRTFAQTMIDDHGASLRRVAELSATNSWPAIDTTMAGQVSTPPDSTRTATVDSTRAQTDTTMRMAQSQPHGNNPYLTELHAAHQQTMNQLRSAPAGASFDKTYITTQVDGHQKVLGIVQQLTQQARNSDLRSHLTELSGKVQAHLERAQSLQRSIAS